MSFINKLTVAALPMVPKFIVRKFAARYIAGETLADAVRVVKELNAEGACATLDVLGEDTSRAEDAQRALREGEEALDAMAREKLDSNLSVKLTQLGLKMDRELCLNNLRELVVAAKSRGNFVRVDMEDSSCTTDTLDIYRALRGEGFTNLGVVIQAYLKRSEQDVRELVKMGANFRLCKGIYVEPPEIAFKQFEEINQNYLRLLRIIFEANCYVGIATHDEALTDGARKLIQEFGLKREQYEFQMLLGVRRGLRQSLIQDGHKLRVYVPFGSEWYRYSLRRFRENPKMAGYVLKAIFSKGG
jgi:proline dehydrogenase